MDDRARVVEWMRREWEGYLEECDGVAEAAEYASGDCASDLGLDAHFVSEVVFEIIRAGV